jgi:hypothetical protein
MRSTSAPLAVEYQLQDRRVPVGESRQLKFRLSDPVTGAPMADLPDVRVLYYAAAGGGRKLVSARSLGDGDYVAEIQLGMQTTYYVFVASRSAGVKFSDLPFFSLIGVPAVVADKPTAGEAKSGGGA